MTASSNANYAGPNLVVPVGFVPCKRGLRRLGRRGFRRRQWLLLGMLNLFCVKQATR